MKALRAILPVTLLSLIFLIAASILQKLALGVPLVPRGFVAPATTGALLGLLLGIWILRNRVQSERIRDNARKTEVLNAQLLVREKELREVLADKSVLLSEVHHRVRNNLQLLSSLLALEEEEHRDSGSEEPARRALLRTVGQTFRPCRGQKQRYSMSSRCSCEARWRRRMSPASSW